MLNLEKFGQKIIALRKQRRMNQNDLAEKLFVTHQAVSKWENGQSLPSIDILYTLTKIFDISIDFLLNDMDVKDDDYETLLRIYPRASIIKKYLDGDNSEDRFEKIFYLLNEKERQLILEQIRLGYLDIPVESFWHMLSKKERMRILSNINNKLWSIDLSTIRYQLTQDEQRFLKKIKIGGHFYE